MERGFRLKMNKFNEVYNKIINEEHGWIMYPEFSDKLYKLVKIAYKLGISNAKYDPDAEFNPLQDDEISDILDDLEADYESNHK